MKAPKVLCTLVVLGGLVLGLAGANATGYQYIWDVLYDTGQTGGWTAVQHVPQATGELAQAFVAPYDFIGVEICSPSWTGKNAGFRMRLFAWNTDYATSVAGAVLGEASIVNYADNSWPQLIMTAAVPAGNYLLVTDKGVSGTGACGHWGWNNSNFFVSPNTAAYRNGVIADDGLVFDIGIAQATYRPYVTVEEYFTRNGTNDAISLVTYPKIGQRFTATQLFDGVEVNVPAWSTNGVKGFTLKLWNWNTDYATTVAQTPLATNVYTLVNDNFWYAVVSDTTLPPGVYFWEMSDPTSTSADLNVGIWCYSNSLYEGGEAYYNGVAQPGESITWVYPFFGTGTRTPVQFGSYSSLSQTFETATQFLGIGIESPSWSNPGAQYHMALYHWNTDFGISTSGTVLAEQTFLNYPDNGTQRITFNSPLPAGQYVLVTDQPGSTGAGIPGHWAEKDSPLNTGADVPNAYIDGFKGTEYDMNYLFNIAIGNPGAGGRDFNSRGVLKDTTAVQDWTQY